MKKPLKDITLEEVQQIVQRKSAAGVVTSLLSKGLIHIYENAYENYQPKIARFIYLQPVYQKEEALNKLLNDLEKAPRQLDLLLTFLHLKQTLPEVPQIELIKQAGVTASVLQSLIQKGILFSQTLEVDRIPFEVPVKRIPNQLSPLQEMVAASVFEGFNQQQPVLLKGVTGSGKTHIYFRCIEACIANNKQALYLLPEIALTAQIVRKLKAVFGSQIGIYHSRFSNNERVEVWKKVKDHQYVGP